MVDVKLFTGDDPGTTVERGSASLLEASFVEEEPISLPISPDLHAPPPLAKLTRSPALELDSLLLPYKTRLSMSEDILLFDGLNFENNGRAIEDLCRSHSLGYHLVTTLGVAQDNDVDMLLQREALVFDRSGQLPPLSLAGTCWTLAGDGNAFRSERPGIVAKRDEGSADLRYPAEIDGFLGVPQNIRELQLSVQESDRISAICQAMGFDLNPHDASNLMQALCFDSSLDSVEEDLRMVCLPHVTHSRFMAVGGQQFEKSRAIILGDWDEPENGSVICLETAPIPCDKFGEARVSGDKDVIVTISDICIEDVEHALDEAGLGPSLSK